MRISLKFKAALVVLLLTLALSATTVFVSYKTYTSFFEEHYETLAMSVAKSTATVVDTEDVESVKAEVIKTYSEICNENGGVPEYENFSDSDWESYHARFNYITEMPEYRDILELLTKLREDHGVVSLYLGYSDLDTMKDLYLVDASEEGKACIPGDYDDMEPEHVEEVRAGIYEVPAFITNYEEYGWLCSASSPIIDSQGNVIGVALVDISMNDIMNDCRIFLITLATIIILLSLIIIFAVLKLVNKSMIIPINKLSTAAGLYVASKKDDKLSGEAEIAKLQIKTGDEIEDLSNSITQMETDLNTYITDLTKMTAEKERIGAELDVAKHIQASMLPCIFPAFPERSEFDIHATMSPAKEVGGDFYDFFMVDERHLAIVMADVSGKGVPAALFMVIAKTLIKDHTLPGCDLGKVFTSVNNLLCESNSEELFVTAFEGVLDLATGEFNFVNAGHEMPYIYKKGETFKPYKIKAGFVLAGMEGMKYTAGSMVLSEGDKIFQYTDGVTEAINAENELYGKERLENILNSIYDSNPSDILCGVKKDIDKFVGDADQFDDITMLCLEYKKKMNMDSSPMQYIEVEAKVENIEKITDFANEFLDNIGCNEKCKMQIDIAIDEIASNISYYAYAPNTGMMTVGIGYDNDSGFITLEFADTGIRYNPLEKSAPDVSLSAEERGIGGLGIHIVKKTMDEVAYEYKDGKNILRIKKAM